MAALDLVDVCRHQASQSLIAVVNHHSDMILILVSMLELSSRWFPAMEACATTATEPPGGVAHSLPLFRIDDVSCKTVLDYRKCAVQPLTWPGISRHTLQQIRSPGWTGPPAVEVTWANRKGSFAATCRRRRSVTILANENTAKHRWRRYIRRVAWVGSMMLRCVGLATHVSCQNPRCVPSNAPGEQRPASHVSNYCMIILFAASPTPMQIETCQSIPNFVLSYVLLPLLSRRLHL